MNPLKPTLFLLLLLPLHLSARAQAIKPSHVSGQYLEAFYLKLESPYVLRYTTNGSSPRPTSPLFPDSLAMGTIHPSGLCSMIPTTFIPYSEDYWMNRQFGWRPPAGETEQLRFLTVAGFEFNHRVTEELTLVYLISDSVRKMPIVSIVTDSLNLFNEEIGIMVPGVWIDQSNPYWTGNYYMTGDIWERPATMQYLLADGTEALSQKVGIRIHGGFTRVVPQKSLRVYARSDYGNAWLNYPFFEHSDQTRFKRLLLRSSMTYWWERNAIFQDEYLQALIHSYYPDLDVQASSVAELFINGEYWGIISIREREDEYYVSEHHNILPEEVLLIEPTVDRVEEFDRILDLCRKKDLSYDENYEQIKEWMDLENYARYILLELFLNNEDWPGNNSKAWKRKGPEGKWKWLIYDFDGSLGRANTDAMERFLASNAPLTTIFKALIQQPEFINLLEIEWKRMRDQLFTANRMEPLLASFIRNYEPGIESHVKRWSNPASRSAWIENISRMYNILVERTQIFDRQMDDRYHWDYDSLDPVELPGEWILYPNPVRDVLSIQCPDMVQFAWSIKINSPDGRLLYDREIWQQQIQLDLSNYRPGVYIVTIENGYAKKAYRVMKM